MHRRTIITAIGSAVGWGAVGTLTGAEAEETPGVTANEIKIGNTMPYSGPTAAYGAIGRGDAAFFRMVNDHGGIAGRQIRLISLDDGYSPPKTVEQTRRLIEQDQVAFIFNSLGTAPNSAIQKYLNDKKVPQLFVSTGADKWGNYKEFPWTIGWLPSYRTEAQIYAKYILAHKPHPKIALFWQNDDFGKDYVLGVKDVLGDRFDTLVVKSASFEPTDTTIDSQIVDMQSAGADAFINAAAGKFAAQVIRKMDTVGWKPLHCLTNQAASIGAVLRLAGEEKALGIITASALKDPTSPDWKDDPGLNEWRAFMAKYMPEADTTDALYVYAYGVSMTMTQVLKQCGDDLSRGNIMKQATNLHDLKIPTLLPGINVNTSSTNYHPIRHMHLQRFDGTTWELFGGLIEGSGT